MVQKVGRSKVCCPGHCRTKYATADAILSSRIVDKYNEWSFRCIQISLNVLLTGKLTMHSGYNWFKLVAICSGCGVGWIFHGIEFFFSKVGVFVYGVGVLNAIVIKSIPRQFWKIYKLLGFYWEWAKYMIYGHFITFWWFFNYLRLNKRN